MVSKERSGRHLSLFPASPLWFEYEPRMRSRVVTLAFVVHEEVEVVKMPHSDLCEEERKADNLLQNGFYSKARH